MTTFCLATALLAIALLERLPALRFERVPFPRRYLATDALYLASGVLALGLLMRQQAHALAPARGLGVAALAALPPVLAVAFATVLYDLASYVTHFLLHRVEVLWRLHKVHHSSRTLDWLATYRAHVLEHALRHLLSTVLLLLIGFPLGVVAVAATLYAIWAALGHSNLGIRLRVLEPVLITPRLHRLHHVPATSEHNLGTILSLWDRLRGTLVTDPRAATGPLGVPGEVETYPQSWLPQLVEPLRRPRREAAPGRSGTHTAP